MGCFFIPELFPGGRCVLEGRRCHCGATSLSLWCPFSPFPTVTCYLRSPKTRVYFFRTRLQLSLFTGGLLCVFSVQTVYWEFHLLYGNFKMQIIKLVFSIFPRTDERLAVISTKLEVEKEQNKSLLEPLCVGNFNNPLVLNGNLTPRANVGFSTSIPCPSNNSMENYLTKITSIIFSPLGFRFLIWMILVLNLVNFWTFYLT